MKDKNIDKLNQINTVAKRIKYIREQKEFTQNGVAMGAGISQEAYSKIERGVTRPSIDRLYDIAESLKVNVYDLIPPARANEMLSSHNVFSRLLQITRGWLRKRTRIGR